MTDAHAPCAVLAPAKINLALHVTGRRADGYHLLESLVVFTEFGDLVTVSAAERDAVAMSGPFAKGLSPDDGNLVVRARDAFRIWLGESPTAFEGGAARRQFPPTQIRLEKNLPIASGIGGGSSDAAATLIALNRLWKVGRNTDALAEIGLPLGADVPMCLVRKPLVARGIGERIQPLPAFPALPIVLINIGVSVSTKRIFAAMANRENASLPPFPSETGFEALMDWLARARNDLMAPALLLEPGIGDALDALTVQRCAFARMSGSGATCFGLFREMEAARRAAASIRAARPDWFVVATRTSATTAN